VQTEVTEYKVASPESLRPVKVQSVVKGAVKLQVILAGFKQVVGVTVNLNLLT
jgi:hypothetical protein